MVEKLANLSWARVAVIGLAAAATLYFFAGSEPDALNARKNAAQQELSKQTNLLKEAKSMAANAVRFEQENKRMEAQFKEMVEFLPVELNATEITRIISEESAKAGTTVVKIGSVMRTEQKGEFYETARIDFQLSGTYSQLVLFLSYLTRVPRLVTFDRMGLMAEGAGASKIAFTATMLAYRYAGADLKADEKADPKASKEPAAKDGNAKSAPASSD